MTTPAEHAEAAIAMLNETCQNLGLQLRGAIAMTVSFAVQEERERCAKVAERVASYYSANNGDNKDVALLVAQEIREGK